MLMVLPVVNILCNAIEIRVTGSAIWNRKYIVKLQRFCPSVHRLSVCSPVVKRKY